MVAELKKKSIFALFLLIAVSAAMPHFGLSPWLPLKVVGGLIALVVVLFVLVMSYCIYREHMTALHQRYD